MKRNWSDPELDELWLLTPEELALLINKTAANRLGYALQLKVLPLESRFFDAVAEVPSVVVRFVAQQVGVNSKVLADYDPEGRTAKRDRVDIRKQLGWRQATEADNASMSTWLRSDVLPSAPDPQHLDEISLSWYRDHRIETPATINRERFVRAAANQFDNELVESLAGRLLASTRLSIDALLAVGAAADEEVDGTAESTTMTLTALKSDPRRPGVDTIEVEIAKLQAIDQLELPADLFADVSPKIVEVFRRRVATEPANELRGRVEPVRYTMLAAYCWQRRREVIDGLVELLIQTVHRIGVSAEHRVERQLLEDFRRVRGKTGLLFKLAEAAVEHPEGIVQDVLFPVVGEQTLRDLVKEYKSAGPMFNTVVHTVMRASYSNHYRRALPTLLNTLKFRCNNDAYRPVMRALELVQSTRGERLQYHLVDDALPIDGVIKTKWLDIVIETSPQGKRRINRINYEICVLQALRDGLRSKEIWVEGADRFRNPDEDLPGDFRENREVYYAALNLTDDPKPFIERLRQEMFTWLRTLNDGLPRNTKVRILQRGRHRLSVTPLDAQPKDYINKLASALEATSSYRDKIHRYSHCITIEYQGERRIDVAPCLQDREYVGQREVCNRNSNQFERSEPIAYTEWVVSKNAVAGGNDLKKVARLLKYMRDIKGNFTCPSFLLTTLLGYRINDYERDSLEFVDLTRRLRPQFRQRFQTKHVSSISSHMRELYGKFGWGDAKGFSKSRHRGGSCHEFSEYAQLPWNRAGIEGTLQPDLLQGHSSHEDCWSPFDRLQLPNCIPGALNNKADILVRRFWTAVIGTPVGQRPFGDQQPDVR